MTQFEKLIKQGYTAQEAKELIAYDEEIDKMTSIKEINSDLSQEQQKAVKQMKNVDTHERTKRERSERQEDTEKINLVKGLADFLEKDNQIEKVEIANKSKLILFQIGKNTYKLDLIRQRKPKK